MIMIIYSMGSYISEVDFNLCEFNDELNICVQKKENKWHVVNVCNYIMSYSDRNIILYN
jgi:hypothetical protein